MEWVQYFFPFPSGGRDEEKGETGFVLKDTSVCFVWRTAYNNAKYRSERARRPARTEEWLVHQFL